ncbi:MAG: Ref family recombination enhancement nuclease [Pontibacterium sp.]
MTNYEREWLSDLVSLGCVVCRNLGYGDSPAEVHHVRFEAGVGQRSDHTSALPLCPEHHRLGGHGVAFHAGPKVWQQQYGTERELLEQVRDEVYQLRLTIIGRTPSIETQCREM